MADAPAHLKEVDDALLAHKLADFGMVLRVFGRGRGHGMVERDRQPFRDQHAILAELLPDAADGRGVVVAKHDVRPRIHHLAHLHAAKSGRAGQRLLCKGLRSCLLRCGCCIV